MFAKFFVVCTMLLISFIKKPQTARTTCHVDTKMAVGCCSVAYKIFVVCLVLYGVSEAVSTSCKKSPILLGEYANAFFRGWSFESLFTYL